MKVITVTTEDPNGLLKNWENTAKICGYQPIILGFNQEWKGWKWRMDTYAQYLETLDPKEIVILSDGTDVFFVGDADETLKKYHKLGHKVIFGAETHCCTGKWRFRKQELYEKLKNRTICEQFFSLNGGLVIGKVKDLLKFLRTEEEVKDDQAYFVECYLENRSIELDYNNEIFGNIPYGDYLLISSAHLPWNNWVLEDRRVLNPKTNTYPSIVHFPGRNSHYYNLFISQIYPGSNLMSNSSTISNYVLIFLSVLLIILMMVFWFKNYSGTIFHKNNLS